MGKLLQIGDVNYAGAFRLDGNQHGTDPNDQLLYQGKIILGMNNTTGNLLVTGLGTENTKNFGEFDIPTPSMDMTVANLPLAANTQNFVNVLDNLPQNTPDAGLTGPLSDQPYDDDQNGISIYGLFEKDNNVLFHYSRYYDDADGYNNIFSDEVIGVKGNATNISSTSDISGAFLYNTAQKACGWMFEIPDEHKVAFGQDHGIGFSSGTTRGILSRHSVGPSFHTFDLSQLLPTSPADGSTVNSTACMDFGYPNGMGISVPANIETELATAGKMWNFATEVNYGFIVPGSNTYVCFGHRAGYNSGITYKLRNNTSQTDWGDFDANDPDDYENIIMFFDVADILDGKNGVVNPYDIQPYYIEPISIPFGGSGVAGINRVSGGTFDEATGRLYLALEYADDTQGQLSNQPLIVAYTFNTTMARSNYSVAVQDGYLHAGGGDSRAPVAVALTGDSNLCGDGDQNDTILDTTAFKVFSQSTSGGSTLVTNTAPLIDHAINSGANEVGPDLSFCHALAVNEFPWRKMIALGGGDSGSGFSTGQYNSVSGDCYIQMRELGNAFYDDYPFGEIVAIMTSICTNDISDYSPISGWTAVWHAYLDDLRDTSCVNDPTQKQPTLATVPIVINGIPPEYLPADSDRIDLQAEVDDTPNHYTYTAVNDDTGVRSKVGELIHVQGSENREFGYTAGYAAYLVAEANT